MIANGAAKGKHAIEGRRGETCYLLIIDAATRQLWTFPLKNKSPPTSLIDSFLKKNGIGRKRFKITTSPEGMLARSNRFQQTCESNGFAIDTHNTEVDFEYVRGGTSLWLFELIMAANSSPKSSVQQSTNTDTSWRPPAPTSQVRTD